MFYDFYLVFFIEWCLSILMVFYLFFKKVFLVIFFEFRILLIFLGLFGRGERTPAIWIQQSETRARSIIDSSATIRRLP